MSQRLPNGLAWTLLGLTVVLQTANVVLGLTGGVTWTGVFGFVPATLSFALVGALIAVRAGNRLGWYFLAGATVTALSVAAKAYASRTPAAELPGAAWAGWIFTVSLGVTAPFFFLVPLLFPDGRPPSPRWRPVVWIAVLAGLTDGGGLGDLRRQLPSDFPHLRDPVVARRAARDGLQPGHHRRAAGVPGRGGLHGRPLPAVRPGTARAAQVVRVRLGRLGPGRLRRRRPGTSNPLPEFEIVVPLIPAAVGIAIFKYRLYDIDRLISRTLAYVIVTGLLVGVYAGLVILAGVLGFSTPPAVAVATLAAAALFSSLRRRVQRAVDKRFNRVRYDAELTVAAFATRLRDAVDLDTVRAELLGVVDSAVQPAHLSVWTAGPRQGGGER